MSVVWQHFDKVPGTTKAACRHCEARLECGGSSTRGLHNHLFTIHGVNTGVAFLGGKTVSKKPPKPINPTAKSQQPKIGASLRKSTQSHTITSGAASAIGSTTNTDTPSLSLQSSPDIAVDDDDDDVILVSLTPTTSTLPPTATTITSSQTPPSTTQVTQPHKPHQRKITDFTKRVETKKAMARMVAYDGLSMVKLTTSTDIRLGQAARGLQMPKSPNTVREHILQYGATVAADITRDLHERRQRGEYVSLTLDEWTGVNNRRYMNINAHTKNVVYNLGLVRILDSLTAERCVAIVTGHVAKFGINVADDVVCCTTDGASLMAKFGRLMPSESQLCYAHGIHLCVCDILYKQSINVVVEMETETEVVTREDPDIEDDVDDESVDLLGTAYLEVSEPDPSKVKLSVGVSSAIEHVRKVAKIFRKSPLKNDTLQMIVKAAHGKEIKPMLDCRTRWNSLLEMLERYLLIANELENALRTFKDVNPVTPEEKVVVRHLVAALKPLEILVHELCKRDCTLTMAHAGIVLATTELGFMEDNPIASKLKESLKERTAQRESSVQIAANVLSHDGKSGRQTEFNAAKYVIITLADKLGISPVAPAMPSSDDAPRPTDAPPADSETATPEAESFVKRMRREMESAGRKHAKPVEQTTEAIVGRELDFFRSMRNRGVVLSGVYDALMTVPPTSVESERAFSVSGQFLTKIRSRLGDNTLSVLVMLRSHFSKESSDSSQSTIDT